MSGLSTPEPGDVDGDGVRDEFDNCTHTRNADQVNSDGAGKGDRCHEDADADGVPNPVPYLDPREPGHDTCPVTPNPGQERTKHSRFGDACYVDSDGDGEPDPLDNCPGAPKPRSGGLRRRPHRRRVRLGRRRGRRVRRGRQLSAHLQLRPGGRRR